MRPEAHGLSIATCRKKCAISPQAACGRRADPRDRTRPPQQRKSPQRVRREQKPFRNPGCACSRGENNSAALGYTRNARNRAGWTSSALSPVECSPAGSKNVPPRGTTEVPRYRSRTSTRHREHSRGQTRDAGEYGTGRRCGCHVDQNCFHTLLRS